MTEVKRNVWKLIDSTNEKMKSYLKGKVFYLSGKVGSNLYFVDINEDLNSSDATAFAYSSTITAINTCGDTKIVKTRNSTYVFSKI